MTWCTRSPRLRGHCKFDRATGLIRSSGSEVGGDSQGAEEDFKDQMSILVSKLLERDSNVEQSFETVEKRLNRHRFALNKAEDQVRLQVLQRSAMSS